eukprot:TRINITY_DN9878_c0_g2_i1.p1 TRINITY_DN9878_c0_g2~~TRINITY_DN9878_c0_g2_i1.p1  ORF type:complete len:533 (+),score=99.28 TRINITY_DN9878_c0_g2_i1:194-1792(+)
MSILSDRGTASEIAASKTARRLLTKSRITDDHVLEVLRTLFKVKPRQQRFRINPPGKLFSVGGTIGATRYKTVHLKLRCFTWTGTRDVARFLNRWRDQRLKIVDDRDDNVRATTIQLNLNFSGPTHIDGNNFGPSEIIAIGNFEGGRLFLENDSGIHERDVVTMCGKQGCSASPRAPGIYRGDLVDVTSRFHHFWGNRQLHCAEETISGERFSLVWFSINANSLPKLSSEDMKDLRACGFRPRMCSEVRVCEDVPPVVNDCKTYPPGFLYFARGNRNACERGNPADQVTRLLRLRWDALSDGVKKGQRGYYAGLERIERQPTRLTTKARSLTSVRPKVDDVLVEFVSVLGKSEAAHPCGDDVEDLTGVSDDEPLMDESEVDLDEFATIVLKEFPEAITDTDLFITILEEFDVAREDSVRAKALNIVEAKRQALADEEFARRIDKMQRMGVTTIDSQIEQIEDSPLLPREDADSVTIAQGKAGLELYNAFGEHGAVLYPCAISGKGRSRVEAKPAFTRTFNTLLRKARVLIEL